jgi:hypothetical protein
MSNTLPLCDWIKKLIDYKYFNTKLHLTNKETRRFTTKFNPTIIINNFTKLELNSQLTRLKNQFIKTNGIFNIEIFIRDEMESIQSYISEYRNLISNAKHLGQLKRYNLFQIQTELDINSNYDTLLLSELNQIQLELHFKMILETFEEFEAETTKLETTDKSDSIKYQWEKIIPLFTEGTVYDELDKNPSISFNEIIKQHLKVPEIEAKKLRPYVSETFNNNLKKTKNDKNLCLPKKAKIINDRYNEAIDSRFLEAINKHID